MQGNMNYMDQLGKHRMKPTFGLLTLRVSPFSTLWGSTSGERLFVGGPQCRVDEGIWCVGELIYIYIYIEPPQITEASVSKCIYIRSTSQKAAIITATSTLLGTNISPEKSILKMIFLFPRWDMLISWRVTFLLQLDF